MKRIRYSNREKKEVVDFVRQYDRKNGRGGKAAAKKKFGVGAASIRKWCVEQGHVKKP